MRAAADFTRVERSCTSSNEYDYELQLFGSVHWPLSAVRLSFTLNRKTVPEHVYTSLLDCEDGVL